MYKKIVLCLFNLVICGECFANEWREFVTKNDTFEVNTTRNVTLRKFTTTAQLKMFCSKDQSKTIRGVRGLEFLLNNADQIEGFNFIDFEGPDASAGVQMKVRTMRGHEYAKSQNGWYYGSAFVFGSSDPLGFDNGLVENVVNDIKNGAEFVEIEVADSKNKEVKLIVRFDVNLNDVNFDKLLCK